MTIDSDSARFSRGLLRAILVPSGVIFVTALLLLILNLQLIHMETLSDHSYQVIEKTSSCEMQMLNLETGVRGYIVNGNRVFLDPYNQVAGTIDSDFVRLRLLVKDNPEQVIRADDLIKAKNLWIEHAKATIAQRDEGKVLSDDWQVMGKSMMDDLRTKFARFSEVEQRLHDKRNDQIRWIKLALALTGAGVVLLLIFIVGYYGRKQFMELGGEYRDALKSIEQRHAAVVRSEADLEEQKEWFRVTLSSIGDGVIVTNEEGRVVFMNHEAERLSGWGSVEALLKPLPTVFRIVNEDTRASVEDPVEKVLREKKVVGMANHTVLISRTGMECPIEDSAAPIYNTQGKMLGVVLVFHNASEMRLAQNALRVHSQDLEKKVVERTTSLQQAFSELEAFSYTVSHDLRSPLRAMQGFSQAVIEDYGDKLDDKGRNYLERIKNAAERLDRLIQDLLAYTRMSRQEIVLVEIDLDRTVREIIEHYPNLQSAEADIVVEGALPKVMGSEAALTQVLSNLLGNAVKFVPRGTKPKIRVWSEDRGPYARIWIEDNGIGIAPENFERIFQMFGQLNEQQQYGGTGMGLSIVKKAAQSMHGNVGLESELGKGSRFWVEIRRA